MLSMFNLRSVVVNVPLVYPVHGLVGLSNLVVVSDWASPRQFIYPKQYEEKYKEYLIEPPHRWAEATDVKTYVGSVEGFLEKRLHLYYEILEREDFDLFVIVFSELDWLMHRIPDIVGGRQLNLVYKVFSLIDRFIRRACEVCDLVVLVSDHGFTISRLSVGVNSILANNGLIAFSYRFNISKFLHQQKQGITPHASNNERGFGYLPSLVLRNLFTLAKKIVPQHVLGRLESVMPVSTEIDYSKSKAFMLEPGNWGVYVKKGYLNVVKNIFNNIGFVKKILHKEEVFWGPYVREAPDLILVPRDHVFFDARIHAEPVYRGYVGEHEPHALIAFYGDNVLPSSSIGDEVNVSIYDLVPTILAYMGLPVPSDSDGKPLTEVFSVELPGAKKRTNYLQRFKILRRIKGIKTT